MRTLTPAIDNFDKVNTFRMVVKGFRGDMEITCTLQSGYEKEGDGILWAMQRGACLKAHYSEADYAETDRLNAEAAIKNGDTVSIDGKQFTVRVLGDYSNAAMFDPIN